MLSCCPAVHRVWPLAGVIHAVSGLGGLLRVSLYPLVALVAHHRPPVWQQVP